MAVLLLRPLLRLKSDCSRKCCPPPNMFVLWLFSLCFPLLCLAAFLLMLPPCACSRNLPPLSSLFCGFSLNVAPLLCLVAFLLLLPPCLSCRCSMLPLSLSCGCSLNIAHLLFLWLLPPLVCLAAVLCCPFLCLTAVLLMLPPSFLVPVLVVCPPCLAAFLLMLLSLALWYCYGPLDGLVAVSPLILN